MREEEKDLRHVFFAAVLVAKKLRKRDQKEERKTDSEGEKTEDD